MNKEAVAVLEDDTTGKKLFLVYQKQLDERHDRHERIVKFSRDITIESKKVIFLLHRFSGFRNEMEKSELLEKAMRQLKEIRENQILKVAKEMSCIEDQFMHHRAITFGIQEYIEASAFAKFLTTGQLLMYDEIKALLTFEESDAEGNIKRCSFDVTPSDYLLGLSDVGGELMRFAINQYSTGGDISQIKRIVHFMRLLYEGYLLQDRSRQHQDFGQKITTFRQSLMKVENLLYIQKLKDMEHIHISGTSVQHLSTDS